MREKKEQKLEKLFAIIDVKQRLETIWGFIDGDFCLSNDFEYLDNPTVNLSGLSYEEANYDYLEYDRLSQHGTNDVSNIKERFRLIKKYIEY